MIQTQGWRYAGSASAQAWDDGGIALIRTAGELGWGAAALVLGDCQVAVDRWRSSALIADYSPAAMGIGAEQLHRHALSVIRTGSGALSLPTALVVRRDELPMWTTYAALMAQAGIVRGVFTDADIAMRWARRQAEVFSADRLRIRAFGR